MSIADNYEPIRTLGNGVTTVYTGSWPPLNASFLVVNLESVDTGVKTLQTNGSDYTLVFDSTGFTVTMAVAPPTSVYIEITRDVAKTQTVPFKTSTGYDGTVLAGAMDKLTAITQDLENSNERGLTYAVGTATTNPTVGEPTDGYLLAFNGTTGLVQGVIPSSIALADFDTLLSGLADNDFLTYNLGAGVWENKTLSVTKTTLGINTTDTPTFAGLNVDNININGNSITSTDTNGDVIISPNGTGDIDADTSVIKNVTDPSSAQDAATKNYVDTRDIIGIKAYAVVNGATGALISSGNITSSVRNSTGMYTITIDNDFASSNWAFSLGVKDATASLQIKLDSQNAGTCVVEVVNNSSTVADPDTLTLIGYE